jgi:protein-tyrosine phosphatase
LVVSWGRWFIAEVKRDGETMIDTHSHLLPGLDHGCPDMETGLGMARQAWEIGTKTVVCTPHFYDWEPSLVEQARDVIEQMRQALEQEGIGLRLLLGFEVDASVIMEADAGMLADLVIEGSVLPGHSQGTILIETPYFGWPPFLEEAMYRLSADGYIPVMAHPERNERVQRSPELLQGCLRAGVVVQGTAGSLAGQFRRSSMPTLLQLLERGDVALLASDGHAQIDYTWSLSPFLEELGRRVSPECLDNLVNANPQRVISGERPLPVVCSRSGGRSGRRSWWRR